MSDKLIISLPPTNFDSMVNDYKNRWDEHIGWVKHTLDDIFKKDLVSNSGDNLKTPQPKKSAKKRSARLTRTTLCRPNANAITSVMTNGTARITRSTSRFLKERNMLTQTGDLVLKVKDDEILEKKLSGIPSDEDKLNQANLKNKKVSFDKEKHRKQSEKEIIEEEEGRSEQLSGKKKSVEKVEQNPSDKENENQPIENNKPAGSSEAKKRVSGPSNRRSAAENEVQQKKSNDSDQQQTEPQDNQPADDQLNTSSQAMECSPVRKTSPAKIDPNLVTPKNKQPSSKLDDEEWLTDDESTSIKIPPTKFSGPASTKQQLNTNSKPKSGLPEPRVAIKRSATVKSASKPVVDIKRNKTNEFATPKSIKKLSRPLNYGSASKKLIRQPSATVTKSAIAKPAVTLPKIVATQSNHLETPSQSTASRYILPPSTSASSVSTSSQTSLKSCPSTAQQTVKAIPRNNSDNKQQRCFAESALKKRLEEEKRRKQLEQKIQTKEDDAVNKRKQFLIQKAQETKSKREERERKVHEGRLLQNAEAEKRLAEQRRLEELRQQAEEEAERRLAEQRRLEELRQQAEEEAKRQAAELKKKQEENEHARQLEEQKRAEELKKTAKKVEFQTNDCNEELQTKVYEMLEKKLIEDKMKCKNTPIKQLVREAVGKTNAEKSLYKPEVDPSLEVINLSLISDDSSISSSEDDTTDIKETASNCTFDVKYVNNKALSSTFIKPATNASAPASSKAAQQETGSIQPQVKSGVFESYDISDLRSDDEDKPDSRVKQKKIPTWATGQDFIKAIKKQYTVGSRARENTIKSLFSSIESYVALEDVFCEAPKHVSKKYERRTSSACWSSPPLTYIDKSFSTFY